MAVHGSRHETRVIRLPILVLPRQIQVCSRHQFRSGTDTEFSEHPFQVLLHGSGTDLELGCNRSIRQPPQDPFHCLRFTRRYPIR